MKTYIFETDEQIQTTDTYLKNVYLPAIKKLGISPVGVFKPRQTDSTTPKKTCVLIPFNSLDEFESLGDRLSKDQEYTMAGADYLNAAHDNPPYRRIESTLLKAFSDMPRLKTPKLDSLRKDRIYELRSYESSTEKIHKNKVDMFNAGGEIKLFDKLGFNAVFYAEVISGGHMPNLMYMTTHANQKDRDANWKMFVDAPEWNTLKAIPKYTHHT